MAKLVYMALLFYVILVGPTAAQTTGTTSRGGGTNLANPYGAVSLPTTTATQTSPATASGTQSSTSGTVGSTSSARATAGGSSATGTAAVSNVPAWVLCPPAGATGL